MVSHAWGMPLIHGSALKGVVRAAASAWMAHRPEALTEIFGAADAEHEDAEAGLVVFHDAWWVPDGTKPFVSEVVTPHHRDYYSEGAAAATDFDDPVPAPQIAVRGRFLFVVEGPDGWRELAAQLLGLTLAARGVGGKTTSGYGLFESEEG